MFKMNNGPFTGSDLRGPCFSWTSCWSVACALAEDHVDDWAVLPAGDQVEVLGKMLETMWMSVVPAIARNHVEAQDPCYC